MVSVAIFISLVWLAFFANAQLDPLVKLNPPFTISPVGFFRSTVAQPGYVNGARDCGGSGRTLQFTHTNCAPALPAVSCVGQVDKESTGEMYFIPGEDAGEVLARVSITTSDGNVKSVEVPIPNISLRAGRSYMLNSVGQFEQDLQGKLFTGRMEIIRGNDKSVLACAEMDFITFKL